MNEPTEPSVDLANVAKSVAETDRRRMLVEQELTEAQSVVETLRARGLSLKESLFDLQRDLETAKRTKADEDNELARVVEERKRTLGELNALVHAVGTLRSDSELQSAAIGANLDEARARIGALETGIAKAASDMGGVDDSIGRMRASISETRRGADALERKLADVEEATRLLDAATDRARKEVDEANAAFDAVAERKARTDAACSSLEKIEAALQARLTDASSAVGAMDKLMADQERQAQALASRLDAVGKLVGGGGESNPAKAESAPSAPPTHAANALGDRLPESLHAITLLSHERLIARDEADRLREELRSGASDRVLREAWERTVGGPMSLADRIIFAEVLHAVGDVKAAIVYYAQAASAKNAPPVIRYLAALAFLDLAELDRAAHVEQLLLRDRAGKLLGRIIEAVRMERIGKADDAVRALTDALEVRGFPKWAYDEALLQLGGVHERRNDMHAALSCYERGADDGLLKGDVEERIRALSRQPAQT